MIDLRRFLDVGVAFFVSLAKIVDLKGHRLDKQIRYNVPWRT
jgi:hypothetical protein